MINWKTSLSGFIGGLGVILPYFGVPQELGNAVMVIGLWALSLLAKDAGRA